MVELIKILPEKAGMVYLFLGPSDNKGLFFLRLLDFNGDRKYDASV